MFFMVNQIHPHVNIISCSDTSPHLSGPSNLNRDIIIILLWIRVEYLTAQSLCLAQQWWSVIRLLSGRWLNDKWRWILLQQNLTSASVRQFQSHASSNLQDETLRRRSAAAVAPESDVGWRWVDCGLAREGVHWRLNRSSEPLPRVSHFLLGYVLSIIADELMWK